MTRYLRIEDIHPEIRAFFESVGKLVLDDEETPSMCFLRPHDGTPGYSVAMTLSELKWLDFEPRAFAHLWEDPNRRHDKWLYFAVNKWVIEDEMLRIIKLKAFL